MGGVAAVEDNNLNNSQVAIESNNTWNTTNSSHDNDTSLGYDETEFEFTENINASADELDYLSGCCSVILHVRDGYDVFAYRRDSTYAANLYITVTNWYGKTAVKEYKTTNSYFFHTIVTLDGWMVGIGGADIPGVVQQLESLAGNTAASGKITSSTISSALSLVSRLAGIGHFVIKAPNNVVGYAIVNGGRRSGLFTMGNGQYLAVPNSPSCYRSGYVSTSAPVSKTMSLAYNNPWGVNHRNVIAYEYVRTSDVFNYITKINVYASKSLRSDNIVFRGNFISGSSLPTTPSKRYIGQIVKKVSRPTTQFGYENMIYTYSKILDTFSTTGKLSGTVGVGPWMVTVQDVIAKASDVKNYIEANHNLPSSITINGISVSLASFLKLLTTSVIQINKNDLNTLLNPKSFGTAPLPKDTVRTGDLKKSDYIAIAQNVNKFMDSKGRAPNFAVNSAFTAYTTSLGTNLGYQNMIYTYSKILDNYNTNGQLPASIKIVPWNYVKNFAGKFTIQQTKTAANYLKTYVETNKKLPSSVPITGTNINGQITNTHIPLPAFLKLLTTTTLKIKNNDNTPTTLFNTYKNPTTTPQDTQKTGTITQAKYIEIAGRIEDYMIRNQKAPPYSSYSPLGKYFGYENLIYTYSKILDNYNKTGTLPFSVTVNSWSSVTAKPGITPVTVKQVVDAAKEVKKFVDSNHKLPSSVNIGVNIINMPTFLKLIVTSVLQIEKNDLKTLLKSQIYYAPSKSQDKMKTRSMVKIEYISIANKVNSYMNTNGRAPGYTTALL